jgi:hypothetical protein
MDKNFFYLIELDQNQLTNTNTRDIIRDGFVDSDICDIEGPKFNNWIIMTSFNPQVFQLIIDNFKNLQAPKLIKYKFINNIDEINRNLFPHMFRNFEILDRRKKMDELGI